MKKNVNGVDVEMTAEEQAEFETYQANLTARFDTEKQEAEANAQAKENLKTSAKAKLVAGTPLTEEEANTIVL